MNKILSAPPTFGDDHFVCRTSPWLEAMYHGLLLTLAGVLTYIAVSIGGRLMPLAIALWLLSGILVLTALRRRTWCTSIHFICDHGGIYFPSSRAQSLVAPPSDVRWLHVPWRNISEVRIQLLLDETANTQGIAFVVVASESEGREFLARHTMLKHVRPQSPTAAKSFLVGFSNISHQQDRVISILKRFQTTSRLPEPIAPVERSLDGSLGISN